MKPHRILKTFNGSQHGNDFNTFPEGEVHPLSDDLAAIAVKEGWAVEHVENDNPKAKDRETKVTGPEEGKPLDLTKLNKKQIVEFAKDNFGIELDEAMKKEELLAAIEAHTAEKAA